MRVTTNNQREYNTSSVRVCSVCKFQKPLTETYYYKDKSRKHGFQYSCIECETIRKKGSDKRSKRWLKMTPIQLANYKAANKRYRETVYGRALFMLKGYQKIDAKKGQTCDLTKDYLVSTIMVQTCTYCGLRDENIGCDRVDNAKGHTKDNVVPCCPTCNMARADKFTFEEMLILGETIRSIKEQRRLPR